MKGTKGFTLIELLIIVIILGILASLATVNYTALQERTKDKEAISNLKMIRVAEMAHRMDTGNYYPSSGSESGIDNINQNLKLLLPSASTRNWNYAVWSSGCSRATRNGGDGRSLFLTINDVNGEPDVGAGCP